MVFTDPAESRIMGKGFPGGSVAKTLCSQCRGPQVWSLVGELDLTYHN